MRHARQWAYPIPALLRADAAQEGEFHVRPGLYVFEDDIPIVAIVIVVEQGVALHVACTQPAMIQIHGTISADQIERVCIEAPEVVIEVEILFEQFLRDAD